MRVVRYYEKKQRGCESCLEHGMVLSKGAYRTACPHDDGCPYKVLDKYKTYEEFMASEDSKILVDEFFETAAGCYKNVSSSCVPKRVLSDGDWRSQM